MVPAYAAYAARAGNAGSAGARFRRGWAPLLGELWPLRGPDAKEARRIALASARAEAIDGRVVSIASADAASPCATGDSNALVEVLRPGGTRKRSLA